MKTVNGIWQQVIDFDKLYAAYLRAAIGKRFSFESMKFRTRLEENLIQIQNELIWRMYKPLPLRMFTIYEPKERKISAPAFRDRVVHHSLVAAIEPAFERRFISDTYACRKGRGTHCSMLNMLEFTRSAKREWGSYWVLKCDVKKFFPSISHEILKATIRRTISDKEVLYLIDTIIDSAGENRRGIPIGALTSQLFANIFLDPLDHYVKETLSMKYYARYMDDFIILGKTKESMRATLESITQFLKDDRDLVLNHRTGIWPGRHGIDFCGYRIWPTHVLPRKRTVHNVKKRLKSIAKRYPAKEAFEAADKVLISFLGYIRFCSGKRITDSVLERASYSPKGDQND